MKKIYTIHYLVGIVFVIFVGMTSMSTLGYQIQRRSDAEHPIPPESGLKRGVNMGNMLEAPNEGDWGFFWRPEFFDLAVEAGFDHVRLPVSWTNHALRESPFTIDEAFFRRIDTCLAEAQRRGLKIILNVHHYGELNKNPVQEWDRALALWSQISERYRDQGEFLYFEILNEPHDVFNQQPELWNRFMAEALPIIRKWHPKRPVLVGPVSWNSIQALNTTGFNPPPDEHLILTVHYYEPFRFTHQGADWVDPIPAVGTTWKGNNTKISSPWQDRSWGTTIQSTEQGLKVTYTQGWAGFYVQSDIPQEGAKLLELSVNQKLNLRIVFIVNGKEHEQFLSTDEGGGDYTVPIMPEAANATAIFIQNNTSNGVDPFLITKLNLVGDTTRSIIISDAEEIARTIKIAADWGIEHKMPVYLGEFGAYGRADIDSRVGWTAAVREATELYGIGWGYWELVAGFGIYDPANASWREPLLRALIPDR